MEPTNHPFRKENDLNQTCMIMFHVDLQGCFLERFLAFWCHTCHPRPPPIKGSLDPPVFQSLGQHESHQTWPEDIFSDGGLTLWVYQQSWLEHGGPLNEWRCISYLKNGDIPAIAMLVYQRVHSLKLTCHHLSEGRAPKRQLASSNYWFFKRQLAVSCRTKRKITNFSRINIFTWPVFECLVSL